MGGDSESAFKNTPIQITFIPLGPFHKNFLKIWASDLVGAVYNIFRELYRARAFPPASCRELSRLALSGEGIIVLYAFTIHSEIAIVTCSCCKLYSVFAALFLSPHIVDDHATIYITIYQHHLLKLSLNYPN